MYGEYEFINTTRIHCSPEAEVCPMCTLQTAATQAEPEGDDVILKPAEGPPLHRKDAYLVLSSMVVPPDALLQLLLADQTFAGVRSTGSSSALRQTALTTTAAIFGAPGVM